MIIFVICRLLPFEFIDAYNLLDLNLRFLSIEKILLNSLIPANQFEEYFESAKWPEADQISIESENILISILPVLDEGLLLLSELSKAYACNENVFTLLPLENEIFRSIGLIFISAKVAQKYFSKQNKQTNPKILNFFEQVSSSLSSQIQSLETFSNFLISLRSDPQIQSKCTKNFFLFLIEFFLDPSNMKKVQGNVLRIYSRFYNKIDKIDDQNSILSLSTTSTSTIKSNDFFDSIKCLNLPINQNSTILICRKCHRTSNSTSTKTFKSRREMIFTANWQQSLWKSRCQCGSTRRIVHL